MSLVEDRTVVGCELQVHDESLRSQIVVGWMINFILLGWLVALMILQSLLTEADRNFRSLHADPGYGNLWLLTYLGAAYALAPFFVSVISPLRTRIFRWVAVVFAGMGLLFLLLHHLSHWYYSTKPDFTSHVIDLVFHTIGIWVLVNSVRWARLPPARACSNGADRA